MEVEVTQENLARALGSASRVASAKTDLPIMRNTLLRTDGNQLLIGAMNMELSTKQLIGAKVIKQGSITVPARLITEFIQSIPRQKVTLKADGATLLIKTDTSNTTIHGMSDEEFPALLTVDTSSTHTSMSCTEFKTAAAQTIGAASSDATRPVLTGVYWSEYDGDVYAAATDGYRLAEKKLAFSLENLSVIIPTSTIQEVLRSIDDDTNDVDIYLDDTQIGFVIDGNETVSRLIDGKFPDYKQLIPTSNTTTLTVTTDELKRVVRLSSLFARDASGTVTLVVDTEKGEVEVHSVASELGENSSTLSVDAEGESQSISLNSRYFVDALSAVQSKEVSIAFSSKLSPCVVRAADSKQDDYLHIVMPIKS